MSPTAQKITSAPVSPSRNSSTKFQISLPELDVDILSVANDGQLLVGEYKDKQLHVYSWNGNRVQTLAVPFDDKVIDAVWSPREHHIVCTTENKKKVVVMSVSGDVVNQTQMSVPMHLSVSPDNDIYVTSKSNGIYYSTDNGTTWHRLVSERGDRWRFHQALKVAPNSVLSNYTVWTIETNYEGFWRLSIYTPDKRTWTDVVLPGTQVKVNNSKMIFDGHTNIYMSDWVNRAVHVWSVNGQYVSQLLSRQNIGEIPQHVALNKQNTLLYVAKIEGFIDVFSLQK